MKEPKGLMIDTEHALFYCRACGSQVHHSGKSRLSCPNCRQKWALDRKGNWRHSRGPNPEFGKTRIRMLLES